MKIPDFLVHLRTEYKPAPGEFLPIDMRKLVEKLELRARGEALGSKGLPNANSRTLDQVETEIVESIRSYALDEEKRTNEQLGLYDQRLQAADPHGTASDMRAIATQSVVQFEAEALAARVELEEASKLVQEHELAVDRFRSDNLLTRPADLPKGHVLKAGLLGVLFFLETFPNAFALMHGDDGGLLGAYSIAIIFSILNLAAGFIIGKFALTNVWHVRRWRQLVGVLIAIALTLFVIALNLMLAHLRDAVTNGHSTTEAALIAFNSTLVSPLSIGDAVSFGLACFGILCALIAMLDGFYWTDRYPGYARVTHSLSVVNARLGRLVEERLSMLDNVQQRHVEELRAARASLRDRQASIPMILAERTRLLNNFGAHIQHLEGVGRYALAVYRDANRAVRAPDQPCPPHFDEPWSLTGISIPKTMVPPPSPDDQEWKAANAALEQSMSELQRAFQVSIDYVRNLTAGSNSASFPKPQV